MQWARTGREYCASSRVVCTSSWRDVVFVLWKLAFHSPGPADDSAAAAVAFHPPVDDVRCDVEMEVRLWWRCKDDEEAREVGLQPWPMPWDHPNYDSLLEPRTGL